MFVVVAQWYAKEREIANLRIGDSGHGYPP